MEIEDVLVIAQPLSSFSSNSDSADASAETNWKKKKKEIEKGKTVGQRATDALAWLPES